jgi:hypothetical protein
MASFDVGAFAKIKGQTGTGTLQAIGMSYGMPSCMLNLAGQALSLLPSDLLVDLQNKTAASKAKAQEAITAAFQKLGLDSGVMEVNTLEGVFKFVGANSWGQIETDGNQLLDNLGGVLGAFDAAISTGAQIYQNYLGIKSDIEAAKACLDKFKASSDAQKPSSLTSTNYDAGAAGVKSATDFTDKCANTLKLVGDILAARKADPSLEPKFVDSSLLDGILANTDYDRFPVEDPGLGDETFRLVYGPPISQVGNYLLTSDGLYYDSQSGGLDPVFLAISGIIPPGDKWTYDYDPNLGGKGEAVSINALSKYSDNLFDTKLIDESQGMQSYYDEDHFLSVLLQQRDKQVYDLSADLQQYIGEYGADSSIVKNQRQIIISEISNHNDKVARRKKQIELTIKVPALYGGEDAPLFPPGKIPINDFSYLEKYNLVVDLQKQKALTFEAADVVGVILPIEPKFVVAPPTPPSITHEHLYVPPVGKGSILYTPSGSPSGTVLSLTDSVVTSNLFAIYNFLETDVALPSSTDYFTTNCASTSQYNSAQLVAPQSQHVFFSGLSIPYLEGIVKNKSNDVSAASGLGSFVRLPDTSEFRDLTYNANGFSMELWTYVPDIMDAEVSWLSATTSSLTKVLVGNENVGNRTGASALTHVGEPRDLDFLENKRGDDFVRGMIMGFTRDRRITQASSAYSYANYDNDPASSLSFFIAPTQSRDLSSCSWINNDDCQDYESFYKMKVDLSATDFGNVSSQFVLIDVTVEPSANEVKFYADGALVATSGIGAVFGVNAFTTPNLPSFRKENSFEYSSTTVDGPTTLHGGPKLNPFYTPWIVGGGYTDGMYKYGNFMGGKDGNNSRSGFVSGLRGHIGSLKFYSKALDPTEVKVNYDAQKGYFKNIKI